MQQNYKRDRHSASFICPLTLLKQHWNIDAQINTDKHRQVYL